MTLDIRLNVKAKDYKQFLTNYVGLVLVNQRGSHQMYNYAKGDERGKLVPKICLATHKENEMIPKAYIQRDLDQLELSWDDIRDFLGK
jgi:predicted RNA binding protein YcfA (HicA-like mRNA interferase family)